MGQDDTGNAPVPDRAQSEAQDQTQDQPAVDSLPDGQDLHASIPDATAGDQSTADDLLHAAHVAPAEMIANVELTLDHLSATVDLFDVPPFDHGDTGGDIG